MSEAEDAGVLAVPDFTPTRAAGLARLAAFAPRAGRFYAAHRKVDHGPERRINVHALEPWLSRRLVTHDEAVAAVRAANPKGATLAFETELAEAVADRAWLDARPELWRRHRLRVTELVRAMEKSPSLLAAYDEAVEGRTGINAFDAWIRELDAVGWLHAEARRAFASLWTFSLRLPWALGADLFFRKLIDGEPAVTLLLWRRVAGLHPGTPHLAVTVDGMAAFSAGRFRPRLKLVEEHATALPPEPLPAVEPPAPATPDPSLRTGWLLTEADLSPETWPGTPAAVAALSAATLRSPLPLGERLAAFDSGALADGLTRAGGGQVLEGDWTRALVRWAADERLEQIVTGPAHAGPVAERLAAARRKLEPAGVRLAFAG